MKTLFFCNLIPNKLGAFEALLVALADEFQGAGDELVSPSLKLARSCARRGPDGS